MKTITVSRENAETYKMIRTNLQYCGSDKKVIAFTSSIPGEGKSSSAFQVGLSLAESGKKVLLVDGDLRNSSLREYFVIESKFTGLTAFLEDRENFSNAIRSTNNPNFHVLLAGEISDKPAELLERVNFRKMILAARKVYDYVLIDTPPIGRVIDAMVISNVCDGIVLVIQSGILSRRYLQKIKKQLEVGECPIIGCIVNKVKKKEIGYGKYGKYGKYGAYGTYGHYGRKE